MNQKRKQKYHPKMNPREKALVEEAKKWIRLIHQVLTPDLLQEPYKSAWTPHDHPTCGHCATAAEALFFLLGGPCVGLRAMVAKTDEGTHWWLEHTSGIRLDPTAEQYYSQGENPPYNKGKAIGFMGQRYQKDAVWGFDKKPSKRALLIIKRIEELNKNV